MFLGKMHQKTERVFPLREMKSAPDTDASLTIRLLTPLERRRVMEKFTKLSYKPNTGGDLAPELEGTNTEGLSLLFDLAVIGWSGIYSDAEGKTPLAFGAAGKRALADMVPEVLDFVSDCHGILVREANEAKEPALKN